jgi:putative transposase
MDGQIRRLADDSYKVHSQRGEWDYAVHSTELGWVCNCPDYTYRRVKCKHVFAVELSQKLRQEVKARIVIAPVALSECGFCHSQNLKKFGIRKNKCGDIQRFLCGDCKRTFSINIGFEKMKHDPKGVAVAMQLYFSGESLRKTSESLKLIGVQVSYRTILNWITKYVGLMSKYLDRIAPQVSDTWRADELYVKMRGDMKYLFAMMDDETRFWIAQQVSGVKEGANASRLFMEAKRVAAKSPTTLITDALGSYAMAAKLDFPNATHIREIAFKGGVHNNKMERMNGEIRDREKTMRGLKTMDTAILKGVQIYHNFIKPHEGLDGKTPAEAAGIDVKGENKWRTLIQNASQNG